MSQHIFNTAEFPALVSFSDHWKTIRDEALALERYIYPFDGTSLSYKDAAEKIAATGRAGWMKAWGPEKEKWLTFPLRYEEKTITDFLPNDNSCQQITSLIKRLHGVKVAVLNILKPGGYTLIHTHPHLAEQDALIFHIGLSAPDNWHWLNVEGTFIQHRNGESFVFDGSKNHFALNFSDQERLILYMEFYKNKISFDESEQTLETVGK